MGLFDKLKDALFEEVEEEVEEKPVEPKKEVIGDKGSFKDKLLSRQKKKEKKDKEVIAQKVLLEENKIDDRVDHHVLRDEDFEIEPDNREEDMVLEILGYSTGLIEEYVVKLKERINKFNIADVVDDTRIAQETVIYSDKCSIDEELTRLKSHIDQFNSLLEANFPVGKKIDFLIQEMNRETNTIGSKSVKLEITNLVIEIKTELENIREQIQNIE